VKSEASRVANGGLTGGPIAEIVTRVNHSLTKTMTGTLLPGMKRSADVRFGGVR
jgi:hypothetical protein